MIDMPRPKKSERVNRMKRRTPWLYLIQLDLSLVFKIMPLIHGSWRYTRIAGIAIAQAQRSLCMNAMEHYPLDPERHLQS